MASDKEMMDAIVKEDNWKRSLAISPFPVAGEKPKHPINTVDSRYHDFNMDMNREQRDYIDESISSILKHIRNLESKLEFQRKEIFLLQNYSKVCKEIYYNKNRFIEILEKKKQLVDSKRLNSFEETYKKLVDKSFSYNVNHAEFINTRLETGCSLLEGETEEFLNYDNILEHMLH